MNVKEAISKYKKWLDNSEAVPDYEVLETIVSALESCLPVVEAAILWGRAELGDELIIAEQHLARELDNYEKEPKR